MLYLILGLVLFLGMHSVEIFSSSLRANAIARMGEAPVERLCMLSFPSSASC